MADNAIGMIETKGYVAALAAADAMVKAANVTIVGREQVGDGLVAVTIIGDVGAVKAATEAGSETAASVGELVSVHVIPRPHAELPLHEQDARLDRGHRAQRQVGDPLDGQRGRDLHDERVLAGERRVAPGAGGRAQVGGELPLQVLDQQVDAQLGARYRRGHVTRYGW